MKIITSVYNQGDKGSARDSNPGRHCFQ